MELIEDKQEDIPVTKKTDEKSEKLAKAETSKEEKPAPQNAVASKQPEKIKVAAKEIKEKEPEKTEFTNAEEKSDPTDADDLLKMLPTKVNMTPLEPEALEIAQAEKKKTEATAKSTEPKQLSPITAQGKIAPPPPFVSTAKTAEPAKKMSKEQAPKETASVLMPIENKENQAKEEPIKIENKTAVNKKQPEKTEPAAGTENKSDALLATAPQPFDKTVKIEEKPVPIIITPKAEEVASIKAPETIIKSTPLPVEEEHKPTEEIKLASTMPQPIINDVEIAKAEAAIKAEKEAQITAKDASLKKIQIWEAREGTSLKKTLQRWAEQANIKLIWNSEKSYDLEMDVFVSGTFENALKTLFSMGVKNAPKRTLNRGSEYELVVTDI